MEQYYTPSGKTPITAHLYFILTALVVLPILATIYAYAIWYIPIPYINFIITGVFGMAIGMAISFIVLRLGKVRSGMWAFIFCLFGALIALYIHWAVWVDLVFNISGTMGTEQIGIATSNISVTEVFSLLLQPSALFSMMSEINQIGVWGIKGGTVSGGFLTFIWVVEILLTLFMSISTGIGQESKPFCEEENVWFEETELPPIAHIDEGPIFTKALAEDDLETVKTMIQPAGDIKTEHHTKIAAFDAASGENYVSIVNHAANKNDKGEIKISANPLVSNLKISQAVMDLLKSNG